MGYTGIKPDIQGISDLFVMFRFIPQQFFGVEIEPGIDAAILNALGDLLDMFLSAWMEVTRHLIHKKRNRHPPSTLPGNTPVRAAFQHTFNPRLTPLRYPLNALDFTKRLFTQALLFHGNKPLRCRPEDNWGFMPPAMRIAVQDGMMME